MFYSKYIALKKKFKRALPWQIVEAIIYIKFYNSKIPNHDLYLKYIKNRSGLEIGGPSTIFKGALPLYQYALSIDGVNFSAETVWEGEIATGQSYNYYADKRGRQFVSDATELAQIDNETYDFVLSSNCIEHIANPVKAIFEWRRVLRAGVALILVAPNNVSNFDHKRNITSFEHIIQDYQSEIGECDLTHLDEILSFHDLSRDRRAGSISKFAERSRQNFLNRTLHHHVFSIDLLENILKYCGFDIAVTTESKFDLFVMAIKQN